MFRKVGVLAIPITVLNHASAASSVASKTKDIASSAAGSAKSMVQADMQNPDNSAARNIIILLLAGIVIIAVFYFIIYLIRRTRPNAEETDTQKKIKEIAESCKRDKSESWMSKQFDKVKDYLLNKDNPTPNLPGF